MTCQVDHFALELQSQDWTVTSLCSLECPPGSWNEDGAGHTCLVDVCCHGNELGSVAADHFHFVKCWRSVCSG